MKIVIPEFNWCATLNERLCKAAVAFYEQTKQAPREIEVSLKESSHLFLFASQNPFYKIERGILFVRLFGNDVELRTNVSLETLEYEIT